MDKYSLLLSRAQSIYVYRFLIRLQRFVIMVSYGITHSSYLVMFSYFFWVGCVYGTRQNRYTEHNDEAISHYFAK